MTNSVDNFQDLNIDNEVYKTRLSVKFKNRKHYEPVNPQLITSFISGTVVDVLVEEGRNVTKDEELVILDAMKIRIKSGIEGRIKKIMVEKGAKIPQGIVLFEFE